MKKTEFKGSIEQFWGKPLADLKTKSGVVIAGPLPFDGSFEAYENISEVRSANDYPSDTDVVKFRNTQRKANERQKAMANAVTAAGFIQPTAENDPIIRLTKVYEMLLANTVANSPTPLEGDALKAAEAEARQIASTMLKIDWPDED